MQSNFTVIYDACVLYPAPLRDLLMHLALTDLYRARWTDMIHDEWTQNLLQRRPDIRQEDLARTRRLMNNNVRDALISGFDHLIGAIQLPDPDDRHVLAAAIHGGCSAIITFNGKDFPEDVLEQYNLEAIDPDDFISDLLDLNAGKVLEAAANHRRSLKRPSMTADQYLDMLLRQKLTRTEAFLRPLKMAL